MWERMLCCNDERLKHDVGLQVERDSKVLVRVGASNKRLSKEPDQLRDPGVY